MFGGWGPISVRAAPGCIPVEPSCVVGVGHGHSIGGRKNW
jgi:hypothetical protein